MYRKPIILSIIEIVAGAVTIGTTAYNIKKEKEAEKKAKDNVIR